MKSDHQAESKIEGKVLEYMELTQEIELRVQIASIPFS